MFTNSFESATIVFKVTAHRPPITVIQDAVTFARKFDDAGYTPWNPGALVTFTLDGITIEVRQDSSPSLIHEKWTSMRGLPVEQRQTVGPYHHPNGMHVTT